MQYNPDTCKSPSTSKASTGSYDVNMALSAMAGSVTGILSKLQELNNVQCSNRNDAIEKANASNLLITELGTRLGAIEVITKDLEDVIGLSSDQIAVLSAAAGFLLDALKDDVERVTSFDDPQHPLLGSVLAELIDVFASEEHRQRLLRSLYVLTQEAPQYFEDLPIVEDLLVLNSNFNYQRDATLPW